MAAPIVHAVVVSAGSGSRLGGGVPKPLVDLAGRPLVLRSAEAVARAVTGTLVVVARRDLVDDIASACRTLDPKPVIAEGGPERADSVRLGVAALDGVDSDFVLVHDGARPLLEAAVVDRVVAALRHHEAAVPAIPAADTVLEVDAGLVVEVPDRSRLRRAQTPQGFRLGLLRRAHERAARNPVPPTDDAGLVRMVFPELDIAVVPGSARNIKVTTPVDLVIAERLLATES